MNKKLLLVTALLVGSQISAVPLAEYLDEHGHRGTMPAEKQKGDLASRCKSCKDHNKSEKNESNKNGFMRGEPLFNRWIDKK